MATMIILAIIILLPESSGASRTAQSPCRGCECPYCPPAQLSCCPGKTVILEACLGLSLPPLPATTYGLRGCPSSCIGARFVLLLTASQVYQLELTQMHMVLATRAMFTALHKDSIEAEPHSCVCCP